MPLLCAASTVTYATSQGKLSDLEFRVSENLVRWQELCEALQGLWGGLGQGPAPSPLLATTHTPSAIAKVGASSLLTAIPTEFGYWEGTTLC